MEKRIWIYVISLAVIIIVLVLIGYYEISDIPSYNSELHYNYGTIKNTGGIWYKTTYFEFENDSQSINVYYGEELFDYVNDNIKKGDFVIVVWKYRTVEAETFDGDITVPWLERLVKNGNVVFP